MRKFATTLAAAVLFGAVATMTGVACQSSHEQGVKSSYHSQWTSASTDVPATTAAAKSVFEAESLKDVKADNTQVDGKVTGKEADGTKVTASIRQAEKGAGSEVTVTVGTMGDPSLGANLAKKIKDKAEGR
jgi:hypothetical protein